ncbi:MAG: hypothetical protein PHR81_11125 [Bacteroidales bacterium]|jgi:hypothetical protein|nr:hypothetical protein [Bacteroidales bacterium]MDD4215354.1 hypothetical protein [Bacteroidales bacterium]
MTKDKKSYNSSHIIDAENLDVDYDFRITHYKIDKNGNYVHELQAEWGGRNPIVQHSWDIIKERIHLAKEKVINGEISPVAYYMEKCISDIKILAKFTGYPVWRVKRHMKVRIFNRLRDKTLKPYADFFEISIEELKDIDHIKL